MGVVYVSALQQATLLWAGTIDPRWPPRPGARKLLVVGVVFGLAVAAFLLTFEFLVLPRAR